jgi:site-specific DNA-methyltransferase (adenine-specific)
MVDEVLFSSDKTDWETPQDLFDNLNERFKFTLDPCANDFNTKCDKYYDEFINGLEKSWEDESVFMNPPYGRGLTLKWVKKMYEESLKDNKPKVALLPARVDTKFFADYCKYADEIYFIKGRLRFSNAENTAPFPSAIVVFNGYPGQRTVGWTNRTFSEFW